MDFSEVVADFTNTTEPPKPIITNCGHLLCENCFSQACRGGACTLCGTLITAGHRVFAHDFESNTSQSTSNSVELFTDVTPLGKHEPSSKFVALINDLIANRSEKAVVFSQWTQLLSLLGNHLRTSKITFLQFDGSMSVHHRQAVLTDFRTKNIDVLLMSLKAGGVGVNWTCASRVYLLDPWWNPATEQQAVDRVHRLGQTKIVHTIRMVASRSIEENIILLQNKKFDMAQDALMDSKDDRAKRRQMRMEDFKALFSLENDRK